MGSAALCVPQGPAEYLGAAPAVWPRGGTLAPGNDVTILAPWPRALVVACITLGQGVGAIQVPPGWTALKEPTNSTTRTGIWWTYQQEPEMHTWTRPGGSIWRSGVCVAFRGVEVGEFAESYEKPVQPTITTRGWYVGFWARTPANLQPVEPTVPVEEISAEAPIRMVAQHASGLLWAGTQCCGVAIRRVRRRQLVGGRFTHALGILDSRQFSLGLDE